MAEWNKKVMAERLGSLKYSDRVNEMYWMYASLYLDRADDSMSHFLWRDHDIAPLKNAEARGLDTSKDDVAYEAYASAARELAWDVLSSRVFETMEDFYEEYPFLRKLDPPLKAVSKKSVEDVKACAINAFKTVDWVIGNESGGIEPPRNIIAVYTVQETDTIKVMIDWNYPPTCGLSDCRYHVKDYARTRRDTFVYYMLSDVMYLETENGEQKLFSNLDPWNDASKQAIDKFYKDMNLYETGLRPHGKKEYFVVECDINSRKIFPNGFSSIEEAAAYAYAMFADSEDERICIQERIGGEHVRSWLAKIWYPETEIE